MRDVVIYTDGSYTIGKDKGGWAFVHADVEYEKIFYQESGVFTKGTNNVAELLAVINAIEYSIREYPKNKIIIYTDSTYVKKGFTDWVDSWKNKGWIKYDGKPVKNLELWKKLYKYKYDYDITIDWVKAHDGDFFNEVADGLAGNY